MSGRFRSAVEETGACRPRRRAACRSSGRSARPPPRRRRSAGTFRARSPPASDTRAAPNPNPNIVTVLDRGEFQGRQYLIFEHVSGETLADLIGRESPLPVARALALASQIGRGLAFAHEHGVVHRDVKPQNILIDESGTTKVTDFGIARSLGAGASSETLTQTGTILGTSAYISPEQVLGRHADARSDQYSLGVALFELLTACIPYPGSTFMEVATRHVSDPVPSVRALRRDVPSGVDALLRRAMAKNPPARFPSMEAMVDAPEACLAWERAGARRSGGDLVGMARLLRSRLPARPRLLALGATLVALVALALALTGGDGKGPSEADASKAGTKNALPLTALRDHDPFGDDREEHAEDVRYATDGDRATYWTTERYSSFEKPGVGIILDARTKTVLGALEVISDEPGFRAKIRAANRVSGPFRDVSAVKTVGRRTIFELDGDAEFRYYLLWITDPNGRAHVNEIQALP